MVVCLVAGKSPVAFMHNRDCRTSKVMQVLLITVIRMLLLQPRHVPLC